VDTSTGSGSSGEGEEEGEITPPPLPSLRITPPPLSDIASRQVGATVSERRLKRTQTGIGSSTDLPRQLHLTPVTSDNKEGAGHSAYNN
jgi:hypothetical protein